MITVVSAAIVRKDTGMILLAQRAPTTSYPFHWCTPGGKFEPEKGDKTHRDALARELREELLVELSGELGSVVYEREIRSTRTGDVCEVICYRIDFRNIVGTPRPGDGTIGVGWFDPSSLHTLDMTPADNAEIEALTRACEE